MARPKRENAEKYALASRVCVTRDTLKLVNDLAREDERAPGVLVGILIRNEIQRRQKQKAR